MEEDKINQPQLQNTTTENSNNWLQKLKNESWEAELLVSAIAIFGTFQLFKVIDFITNMFINLLPTNQYYIGYFITFFGLIAISVLVAMFVIHFFLRAYWVGLVGLNSVFPDYSLKDSAYSEIYTKKILAILPKLKDSVTKVDEMCSVIFSAAFTFLLTYSYLAISTGLYLLLFNLLSDYVPIYILLLPLVVFGIIYLLQVIITIVANLKAFKQNEKIQHWYFILIKIGSLLMLGPLYKSILQITMIFGSNFKKKKGLIYLLLLFLFSGFFVSVFQISQTNIFYLVRNDLQVNTTMTYANYYKTENENLTFLLTPEITSDIIESKILKVFIPIFYHEKTSVCEDFVDNEKKSKEENRAEVQNHYLQCYQNFIHIYINGEKIDPNFLKYDHPKTNQFGVLSYIRLKDAIDGRNTITIKKILSEENTRTWAIPFEYISE